MENPHWSETPSSEAQCEVQRGVDNGDGRRWMPRLAHEDAETPQPPALPTTGALLDGRLSTLVQANPLTRNPAMNRPPSSSLFVHQSAAPLARLPVAQTMVAGAQAASDKRWYQVGYTRLSDVRAPQMVARREQTPPWYFRKKHGALDV